MSEHPDPSRRRFVRRCALAAAAVLAGGAGVPAHRLLAADPADRFDPDDPEIPNEQVRRAIRARFGDRPIRRGHVQLDMPVVAEDGRVVPVIIESDLPMTDERYVKGVHLFVDHNPDVQVAAFHLTPAMGEVMLTTRIKMRRTTWVRALVETNAGEVWAGYAHVRVTLNGCG
ncbi:MAG TPA: thiosulfate oxidation carrier protein SoxY [Gemmatimonadales bacterium]|nr:thiosulfate oxidation carrier protein SoxY [Gemmatimonadales bacterium]